MHPLSVAAPWGQRRSFARLSRSKSPKRPPKRPPVPFRCIRGKTERGVAILEHVTAFGKAIELRETLANHISIATAAAVSGLQAHRREVVRASLSSN